MQILHKSIETFWWNKSENELAHKINYAYRSQRKIPNIHTCRDGNTHFTMSFIMHLSDSTKTFFSWILIMYASSLLHKRTMQPTPNTIRFGILLSLSLSLRLRIYFGCHYWCYHHLCIHFWSDFTNIFQIVLQNVLTYLKTRSQSCHCLCSCFALHWNGGFRLKIHGSRRTKSCNSMNSRCHVLCTTKL